MAKDDLGLDVDDDVAGVLKDPKGGLLVKTFDYLTKRKAREKELADIAAQEQAEKDKKDSKFLGIF